MFFIALCSAGLAQGSDKPVAPDNQTRTADATKQKDKKHTAGKADETSEKLVKEIDSTDASQYVGADTCKTCHEEQALSYNKGPHWKTMLDKRHGPQWQGCEACHGPGKAHAESADPEKIIRFAGLSREDSSRRCLTCHEFGQEHANFLRSEHVKNNVGCVDCHSIHAPRMQEKLLVAAQAESGRRHHVRTHQQVVMPAVIVAFEFQ